MPLKVKIKVQVHVIVQISQYTVSADFIFYTPRYLKILSECHLDVDNAVQFSAAVAIHTLPIFVPPGTHYYWVDRSSADLKISQGFYT